MKTIVRSLFVALLGSALVSTGSAAPINWQPADPGPREPDFGHFEGRVRQINPHMGPGGMYYTFSYHTVSGTTMAYCQQQLTIWVQNGGSVVEDCVRVY